MPEASATLIGVGSAEAPARLTYLAAAASLVGEGASGRAGARLTTPQFIVPEDSRQTPDEAALADLPALEGDWTKIEQDDATSQTHYGARLTAAGWEPATAFEQGATKHGPASGLGNVDRIELDRTTGRMMLYPNGYPDDVSDPGSFYATSSEGDPGDGYLAWVDLIAPVVDPNDNQDPAITRWQNFLGAWVTGNAADTGNIQHWASLHQFHGAFNSGGPARVLLGIEFEADGSGIPIGMTSPYGALLYMGEIATPATPDPGIWVLYPKTDGYYVMGDDGVEVGPLGTGGGGSLTIEDEGVSQGTATTMNFAGSGVTAAVAAGEATVTISGGGGGGDALNVYSFMGL